ncbi:MAG: nitroreductase family protein [Spirochaetes bacterium]|nr:nitroreductase family protein [Spirochaetota bacterium]
MENQLEKSQQLLEIMKQRHSCRQFSQDKVDKQLIINCIKIAASAPSGANMQPWTFVLVENDQTKKKIRKKAEEIEKDFYQNKISTEWQGKLDILKTTYSKPFLQEAPFLICVFMQKYGYDSSGEIQKHYYTVESSSIAVGFLISALHQTGLSTLTYTPSPSGFMNQILNRPENERLLMILPVGICSEEYEKPAITKKTLKQYLLDI